MIKIFACRCAVGACILGLNDQRVPGEDPRTKDIKMRDKQAGLMYDTGIGQDASTPDRWITYNDAQAYPEYIVWCKR